MEKDRCWNCEYEIDCKIAHMFDFCDDCKDYYDCDIKSYCDSDCKKGYQIECNNGFEPNWEYDEYYDNDEESDINA